MLTLQIDESDVFQVTRESIEGELPEWVLELLIEEADHDEDVWMSRCFVLGAWGDYLINAPEPFRLTVATPDELEAMRAACPFERAAKVTDKYVDRALEASPPDGSRAQTAGSIAKDIRNLAKGGEADG